MKDECGATEDSIRRAHLLVVARHLTELSLGRHGEMMILREPFTTRFHDKPIVASAQEFHVASIALEGRFWQRRPLRPNILEMLLPCDCWSPGEGFKDRAMKSGLRIIGLVFLCLVGLISSVYAAEGNYSLILAEYGKDSDGAQTQTLVRYHFKSGVMVAKESILTARTSDLRYDLGRNQIYNNRYVITGWGDVIDLTTRQILFKSRGTLVGLDQSSDKVVVRVERDDASGVYAFDLASHQNRSIERSSTWAMPGTASPNGRLSASGQGGEIWLHRPNGEKTRLGSDFWQGGTMECSSLAMPTFIWVDDKHLLTQRGNGHLVVVDVEGKAEPLVTIPNVDAPACGPQLRRDSENQIYYQGKQKAWRIDIANRTFEPYLWEASGNGFDREYQRNALYGQVIRYRGKEIGRCWCDSAATTPGHIAVEFGPVGSNLGYPEGVKVWSAETDVWITLKPDWLVSIIGWIEE